MWFGAHLLGYARQEVDSAALARARWGALLSLNHPLHLDFLDAVLPRLPGAEMGVFLKTGSEATTAALRIARQLTRRRIQCKGVEGESCAAAHARIVAGTHLGRCATVNYGVSVSVCSVCPGRNGVGSPRTHAACELP